MAQNCIGGVLNPSKTLKPKCIPINHPNPSSLSSSSLRKFILTKSKKCLPPSICISASMSSSQQHQPPLSLEALKTSERRNEVLNAIQSSLSNCLSETHLDLTVPGLKSKTRGKVIVSKILSLLDFLFRVILWFFFFNCTFFVFLCLDGLCILYEAYNHISYFLSLLLCLVQLFDECWKRE